MGLMYNTYASILSFLIQKMRKSHTMRVSLQNLGEKMFRKTVLISQWPAGN